MTLPYSSSRFFYILSNVSLVLGFPAKYLNDRKFLFGTATENSGIAAVNARRARFRIRAER